MKKITVLIILFSLMAFKSHKVKKIIFFGDSITQMGISKGGYINRIKYYLDSSTKSNKYQLMGAGVGGNKIYDLYLRIDEDIIDKKPDIVIVYEGVNDVWHKTSGTNTATNYTPKIPEIPHNMLHTPHEQSVIVPEPKFMPTVCKCCQTATIASTGSRLEAQRRVLRQVGGAPLRTGRDQAQRRSRASRSSAQGAG